MLFISHNYKDKPIVEQIAVRLKDIFGQDKVFYDSWSIQPGDGIIDRMNQGLDDCELFLFFVSKNSLESKMVSLEWQNAVIKATKGSTKIIPVKIDDCLMPPILLQSLYINLFGQGLEVALRQIIDISQGKNTFQSGSQEFSNLRAYKRIENDEIIIECHAEHYLEPISSYLFLTQNDKKDFKIECTSDSSHENGFSNEVKLNTGLVCNGQLMKVSRGTLPGFPFCVKITKVSTPSVDIIGILHETKKDQWNAIPISYGIKE